MDHPTSTDVLEAVIRVERKLDILLEQLAEEDPEEAPELTLDGEPAGRERNPDVPL